MAVSDFIKKYFGETSVANPSNLLSGVKKTGSSVTDFLKTTGQASLRAYSSVAPVLYDIGAKPLGMLFPSTKESLANNRPVLTPSTAFQKELYGTDKPITPSSVGSEVGLSEKSKFAPVVGFALGVADLIPGGKVTKSTAVGLLKNANKADDAFKALKQMMGIADDVAKKYAPKFATMTDAKQISTLVDTVVDESQSVGRMLSKGKEAASNILKTPVGETERKFITSVKEALPNIGDKVAGQYIPRSTNELAIKAKNFINEDIVAATKLAMSGSDESAVAVASELIKKYGDEALKATDPVQAGMLYDKAAEIANTLAPKLTEQGRAIQAASILGRLTPEGQLRFAAREIQKYNELNPLKKLPELSGEQAKDIVEEMNKIREMPDGIIKARAFQALQDKIQALVPTPLIKKVIAVWKAGLLTGIKTSGLNIFSNLSHSVSEVVKDVPAAMVDSVASLITGERTKTANVKGLSKGFVSGFKKGLDYFKTGFDERNMAQKLDYKKVNFGKGAVAKAFQTYTDTVFRALGSTDQPFYYGALSRSLMDQAKAKAINAGLKGKEAVSFAEGLIDSPTEEMIRYATADAATAVFQNETYLGKAAKALQNIPVVGEILVPFGRTPSAVATQIINYSPVGIAKTIVQNIGKGRFDQRLFSEGVGRGLTGTAVLAIGVELAKKGLVALDRPTTEREQKLWELEGRKQNSIKIGGTWRSPTVLGPAGNLLLIGAHFNDALQTSGSPTEALAKTMTGAVKSFTEQTFLTGINSAVQAVSDPDRYAESYLGNLVSSIVPTIASDVARATDTVERRPESIVQRLKARIPGLRKTLEPQIDVLGKEKEIAGNPLEVLIDPTRPQKDISTPVIQELRRLTDDGVQVSPTLIGDKKGFKALTPKENTELWKRTGEIIDGKLGSLFNRDEYKELNKEEKGKIVEKVIEQSKINARAELAITLTDGLSGDELKKRLSELKQGGLLTGDVFKKYVELR